MEDEFFFALLRISIAQILKASGFDKCKPSVLNIVTELYIKHLEQVIQKAKKFSIARTSAVNSIAGQDVIEALLDCGFIKATSPNDVGHTKNTKSLKSFKDWLIYSDNYAVSKRLSSVPTSLLANLIEKRKIDTSSETDQERKKRRLRERQEFFNQLKQGDENGSSERPGDIPDDIDEEELTTSEKLSWLAYLAEKDMKLGQNMKFVNTCIQDDLINAHKSSKFHPAMAEGEDSFASFKQQIHNYNRNDHLVIPLHEDDKTGDQQSQPHVSPSTVLKSTLPYNVQYEKSLIDDDLQQYIRYASTNEDEKSDKCIPQESKDLASDTSQKLEHQHQDGNETEIPKCAPAIKKITSIGEAGETNPVESPATEAEPPSVELASDVVSPNLAGETISLPTKDTSPENDDDSSHNKHSPS